ncbi:crosslink repair DNA glycosylase YcaQ family protein [Oscillospiraceae bacterium 50-60]
MGAYTVNRPEEAAMRRLLARNPDNAAGAILRLAWLEGLLREEITTLTWDQVSFLDHKILLPGRAAPMEEEMEEYLRQMYARWSRVSEYVVFSKRFGKPMQPQAISRAARRELDSEGQTAVRLIDLRHDYIIRQLQTRTAAYVAQITGMEVRTLQLHFSEHMEADRRPTLRQPRQPAPVDEFRLWKILQAEKDTAAGLALWLAWQMGLSGGEIVALTWDQVDFAAGVLRLESREVHLSSTVRQLLLDRRERGGENLHVLLSDSAGRPLDVPRLSRIVRTALIRGGMDQVTLRDLYRSAGRSGAEAELLELVRQKGAVSRGDAMEALGVTSAAAYGLLRRMTDERRLVRVGGKYYLPGTVVPPEEQPAAIREYLGKVGFAYRQDIAGVLRVGSKQCGVILKHLVEAGELVQVRQKYYLNTRAEAR